MNDYNGVEIEDRPGIYIPQWAGANKEVVIIVLPDRKIYFNHKLNYMAEAVESWFRAVIKYKEAC